MNSLPGTADVRFWRKVEIEMKPNGCWLWTANKGRNGYGQFGIARGVQKYVHRLVYEMFVGPIPTDLEIDHLCKVRNCCNPRHLEAVTHLENCRRGTAGDRERAKTHCPHGHPYSPENTYMRYPNKRRCLTCERTRCREKNRRVRAFARSMREAEVKL